MNAKKPPLPSRERRVWKMMWGMLAATLSISAAVVIVSVFRSRAQGNAFDFLSGVTTGMLFVLPFGMAFFLYLAYRRMDEFGQRLQQQACTFAFTMTMLAAAAGYVIASAGHLTISLWTLYVFGMAAYTAAVVYRSLAARGGSE